MSRNQHPTNMSTNAGNGGNNKFFFAYNSDYDIDDMDAGPTAAHEPPAPTTHYRLPQQQQQQHSAKPNHTTNNTSSSSSTLIRRETISSSAKRNQALVPPPTTTTTSDASPTPRSLSPRQQLQSAQKPPQPSSNKKGSNHHTNNSTTNATDRTFVELSELKHEQVELRRQISQLTRERDALAAALESCQGLAEENETLQEHVQELLAERVRLEKELESSVAERNAVQDYLQRQTEDNAAARARASGLEEQVTSSRSVLSAKDTLIRELEEELDQARHRIKDMAVAADRLHDEHSDLKSQHRETVSELHALQHAKAATEAMQEELLATIRDQQERAEQMRIEKVHREVAMVNNNNNNNINPSPQQKQEAQKSDARMERMLETILSEVQGVRAVVDTTKRAVVASPQRQSSASSSDADLKHVMELLALSEASRQVLQHEVTMLKAMMGSS
eukprot:PhM_4_TR13354/c3_g1_i1/m.14080